MNDRKKGLDRQRVRLEYIAKLGINAQVRLRSVHQFRPLRSHCVWNMLGVAH